MSVDRRFAEYVILVDPATKQPYKAVGGTGGGGTASSVNLLDQLGNPITNLNPLPITGAVSVTSLPSVTVTSLPSVTIGSMPSVTIASLPALPTGANVIGAVTQSGTWTVQQGGAPWSVTISGTAAATQSGTWAVGLSAGANTIGKVDQGVGGVSAWKVDGTGGSFPVTGTVAISGSVTITGAVTQSGTWNVGLSAGGNVIGGVTQSGTWTVSQGGSPWGVKSEVQLDYDTGAGTQNLSLVGLALPASGGAVAGGTVTNPFTVTGGVTVSGAVTVSGTVAATQSGAWSVAQSGTWNVGLSTGANVIGAVTQSGTWTVGLSTGGNVIGGVTQSGTWNVTVNAALPTGGNVIGAVTQSGTWTVSQGGSPWGVKTEVQLDYDTGAGTQNLSLVGLALPASGGAVAGGTATNPFTVAATQSGTWTVQQGSAPWSITGNKTNNNAAPGATNVGTLPVLATAAAQTWAEGNQVALSADLAGNLRVGTHAVTQSGTWNVGLSTGANVIGGVTQSGTWTVQQGGAPWSVSQSGTWNVTVNAALPTGGNVIGGVTQSGTWTVQQGTPPWSVSQSGTWNVGLSTGVNVIGGVTQSGTWTVQQGTPPWSVTQSGTWNVTVNTALPTGTNSIGTVVVAQLPAAAALADGTANPTTTLFGAMPHVWNGATWDRLKDVSAANGASNFSPGILGAGLVVFDTVGGTYTRVNSAASGVAGGLDGKRIVATGPMGYDGNAFYNFRLDASKNLNVAVNAALPAGGNVIGGVTQSGTWTVQTGSILSTVATRSSVGASTSSLTLLAANASRIGALIYNDSSKLLYLALGTGATTTNYTTQMPGGSLYEVPFSFTGIITGVWAATNGSARVTELT